MGSYCPECGFPLDDVRITNPHNEKDEFCSEDCACNNRVSFCESAPQMYVLHAVGSGACRGVYSKDNLRLGVQYWMEFRPEDTLSYERWSLGYPEEPEEWEWCYISPDASEDILGAGGGSVPKREFWGKNLVDTEWKANED